MTFASNGVAPAHGRDGSWSYDDPDRPRWDEYTEAVAEYDYHDPDGHYQCTVRRGIHRKGEHYDREKRFTVARRNLLPWSDRIEPEQKPDWLPGMGDARPTLYRLLELLAAPPLATIFVCEGEKDVETLRRWGLIATCNFGGAENWWHEWGVHLADRHVVIVPDKDSVGRKHAAQVLQSVAPRARSVKLLELPDLPDKGDVTDWAEAGGTREELLRLVEATPVVTNVAAWAQSAGTFATSPDGKPLPTQGNVALAVTKLGARVLYDEFASSHRVLGLPPFGPLLCDAAMNRLRLEARQQFRLHVGKDEWNDMLLDLSRRDAVHPVKAYWATLEWDGVARIGALAGSDGPGVPGWLTTYAGAPDTPFVRAAGRLVLVAAVRRVMQPGAKFDNMLVLVGPQGGGKSTLVQILAVRPEWLMDGLELNADNKAVMELLAGRLIVEVPELSGIHNAAVEKVKAMLSRTHDRARLPYARLATQQPRTCVFIGTTNTDEFLRDLTGNRRFWPVTVGTIDLDALARDRDQLWAEAVAIEALGEPLTLPRDLWDEAAERAAERLALDPWEEILAPMLEGRWGKVRTDSVWGMLGVDPARRTQQQNNRLGQVMRRLGWTRARARWDGDRAYVYVKGDGPTDELPKVELGHEAGRM